jgi:hypothetical protein
MPGFDSSKVGVLFLLFLCVYIKYIILMENNCFFWKYSFNGEWIKKNRNMS